MKDFFKALYFKNRLFLALGTIVFCFLLSYQWPALLRISVLLFFLILLLLVVDVLLLFRTKEGLKGRRIAPEKLSNGDENPIEIYLENKYGFPLHLNVIDEIPHQFQKRDLDFDFSLPSGNTHVLDYDLRPVKRGTYSFGALNVFATGLIGFVARRYRFSQDKEVPVYPSFLQMRKYELLAISNRLTDYGIKKIRKVGHNMEFDHIKEYVLGDDYRTINWKATARKGALMVNNYQDEKSQQVYSIIDKGRTMKMPFNGMSLMDYAINAGLVISNIAIKKEDKAGLISFHHKLSTLLPASRRNIQMRLIQEALYNQKTSYKESNFEALYAKVKHKITQRSLLLLFTNFESLSGMRRQMPYLTKLAKDHLLVCIFFENTELDALLHSEAQ